MSTILFPWFQRPTGAIVLSLVVLITACGSSDGPVGPLTIYSGRGESLVGPILERFEADMGIAVEVRYGETAEMAATILEEGEASPAEVFLGQDAGALGALADAGMFSLLSRDLLDRVAPRYRSPDGLWIGVSGRPRVVTYNTAQVTVNELPQSLGEVVVDRFRGRFGIAPTNASFQAHMAVYRALNGADALRELLAGIVDNEAQTYTNNRAIVTAVIAGEIDWGLTNHYYLWRAITEDPEAPASNFLMPAGDASSFVNIAGAGIIRDSNRAQALLDYLVSDGGQRYFAQETFEYPLVAGVESAVQLQPLDDLRTPDVNFGQVSDVLEETLEIIRESGLIR